MFSIILCTFNRAHLIRRAIESVLVQTYSDWELIIINDGSRDNTADVIKDIIDTDSRIHYHYQENQGHSTARDRGYSFANGRYITFIDSDDEYLPEHLEKRDEVLSAEPAIELLHGGVEVIGDDMVPDKDDPSMRIPISDCVVGGTFFIRRDLWARIGGFGNVSYGDDNEFFQRAEGHGAFIKKVDFPTYRYYRTEADSLCNIAERDGIDGILKYRGKT